jgi:hypothetical protein
VVTIGDVVQVLAGDEPDDIADLALVVEVPELRERAGVDLLVPGELGRIIPRWKLSLAMTVPPTRSGITAGPRPAAVMGFTVAGGRVTEIDGIADPGRLSNLDLTALCT